MKTICLYFEIHQIIHLKRYRFFDIGTDHYYYDDYENERSISDIAERSYMPALDTFLEMIKSNGKYFKVAFSISDKPETVHNLLLQKFDGTYCLVVWGEKYLGGTDKIEVRFRDTYSSIAVYDPTVGTEPVETLSDTNVVPLEMSNKPFILQFR